MRSELVANTFPVRPSARRIAIIGEAPGLSEVSWVTCANGHGFASEKSERGFVTYVRSCPRCFSREVTLTPQPFVGASGWRLTQLLQQVGIEREGCWVGNIVQRQPVGNDIAKAPREWFAEGEVQLKADLATYQPHFCLLLGNTPLRAFKGTGKFNVGDWRGTLFMSNYLGAPVKCMATYHPAALLREEGLTTVARFDLQRCRVEAQTDELVVPVRRIKVLLPEGCVC